MSAPTIESNDAILNRLCAKAMGWHTGKLAHRVVAYEVNECAIIAGNASGGESVYDPLHDDAQAMALVKKLGISVRQTDPDMWDAWIPLEPADGTDASLNRAIVKCVARLIETPKGE